MSCQFVHMLCCGWNLKTVSVIPVEIIYEHHQFYLLNYLFEQPPRWRLSRKQRSVDGWTFFVFATYAGNKSIRVTKQPIAKHQCARNDEDG